MHSPCIHNIQSQDNKISTDQTQSF